MSTSKDTPPGSYPGDPDGTTLLYNNILLYCDLLQLYKFNTSIHDGNIGRTFEVIKVILAHFPSAYSDFPLQWLCFYFFGTGSSNYGNELLHQACDFWWHLSPESHATILACYLVNPSGLPGSFHEHDLLQEHLNFWLKHVFNGRKNAFDSSFLWEAMSLNIIDLHKLHQSFLGMLGIAQVQSSWTQADLEANINHLRLSYLQSSLHQYTPGHTQSTLAPDAFVQGGEKIRKVLLTFLHKYGLWWLYSCILWVSEFLIFFFYMTSRVPTSSSVSVFHHNHHYNDYGNKFDHHCRP